jgi:hypothetical protein
VLEAGPFNIGYKKSLLLANAPTHRETAMSGLMSQHDGRQAQSQLRQPL